MSKPLDVSLLLDYYGCMLTEKQRNLAFMYYDEDFSLAEIAKITGLTRQGVYDSVRRTEASLRDLEKNIGFYQKMNKIFASMEEVKKMISDVLNKSELPSPAAENLNKVIHMIHELMESIE